MTSLLKLRHYQTQIDADGRFPKDTMNAADWEIEEHVAKHNQFFKQTHFTLDDLNVYAKALGPLDIAVYASSVGTTMTDQQVIAAFRQAETKLRIIDAALDLENAA